MKKNYEKEFMKNLNDITKLLGELDKELKNNNLLFDVEKYSKKVKNLQNKQLKIQDEMSKETMKKIEKQNTKLEKQLNKQDENLNNFLDQMDSLV